MALLYHRDPLGSALTKALVPCGADALRVRRLSPKTLQCGGDKGRDSIACLLQLDGLLAETSVI